MVFTRSNFLIIDMLPNTILCFSDLYFFLCLLIPNVYLTKRIAKKAKNNNLEFVFLNIMHSENNLMWIETQG